MPSSPSNRQKGEPDYIYESQSNLANKTADANLPFLIIPYMGDSAKDSLSPQNDARSIYANVMDPNMMDSESPSTNIKGPMNNDIPSNCGVIMNPALNGLDPINQETSMDTRKRRERSNSPKLLDLMGPGWRPFDNFRPQRYGVQMWKLFNVRMPSSLQRELMNFLNHDDTIAESIAYWGQRMSLNFRAPRNLLLSILTDFTWLNSLILIEGLIQGKLDGLSKFLFAAQQYNKQEVKDHKHFAALRKQYYTTIQHLKEKSRYPTGKDGEQSTAKQEYDSKMAELVGGDEVSFVSEDFWAKFADDDKDFIKMHMEEKIKDAYQEGRQAMKPVISETVKKLVDANRSKDELGGKLKIMTSAKEQLEEELRQRDLLIQQLTSGGGHEVFMSQIADLQSQVKRLQTRIHQLENEKLSLEDKLRGLADMGEIEQMNASLQPKEEEGNDPRSLKKKIRELNAFIEKLEEERKGTQTRIKKLNNELDKTKEQVIELQKKLKALEASKGGDATGNNEESLKDELLKANTKIKELERDLREAQRKLDQFANIDQTIVKLEDEIAALKMVEKKLTGNLADANDEIQRLKKLLAEAKAASPIPKSATTAEEIEEQEKNSSEEREKEANKSGKRKENQSSIVETKPTGGGLDYEEQWVFSGDVPFSAKSEQTEVRINGLSGFTLKETDDNHAKLYAEDGKSYKLQKKTVEQKGWVFADSHPYGADMGVKKRGSMPVPEFIVGQQGAAAACAEASIYATESVSSTGRKSLLKGKSMGGSMPELSANDLKEMEFCIRDGSGVANQAVIEMDLNLNTDAMKAVKIFKKEIKLGKPPDGSDGIYVEEISDDALATKTGINVGDIIKGVVDIIKGTGIETIEIKSETEFWNIVDSNNEIKLHVQREGHELHYSEIKLVNVLMEAQKTGKLTLGTTNNGTVMIESIDDKISEQLGLLEGDEMVGLDVDFDSHLTVECGKVVVESSIPADSGAADSDAPENMSIKKQSSLARQNSGGRTESMQLKARILERSADPVIHKRAATGLFGLEKADKAEVNQGTAILDAFRTIDKVGLEISTSQTLGGNAGERPISAGSGRPDSAASYSSGEARDVITPLAPKTPVRQMKVQVVRNSASNLMNTSVKRSIADRALSSGFITSSGLRQSTQSTIGGPGGSSQSLGVKSSIAGNMADSELWKFTDLGNDVGEVVYIGDDPTISKEPMKVINKVKEVKNVYIPVDENPLIDSDGNPLANEIVVEHVAPAQMKLQGSRYDVKTSVDGNMKVIFDRESNKTFYAQKTVKNSVDHKEQKINRLRKYLSDAKAELEEKDLYCKKLETAITELQSKFNDLKQHLAKAGVRTNIIDAAMKDSGLQQLLFGAKNIRKVYERLYRDALDRMIRREHRANKHWGTNQKDLMSVLHLSNYFGEEELSPQVQKQMYQDFYKGFETFEEALNRRIRKNKVIQAAGGGNSPIINRGGGNSPKRRLFFEDSPTTSRGGGGSYVRNLSRAERDARRSENRSTSTTTTRRDNSTTRSSKSPEKGFHPPGLQSPLLHGGQSVVNNNSVMFKHDDSPMMQFNPQFPTSNNNNKAMQIKALVANPRVGSSQQQRSPSPGKGGSPVSPQEAMAISKKSAYSGMTQNPQLGDLMNLSFNHTHSQSQHSHGHSHGHHSSTSVDSSVTRAPQHLQHEQMKKSGSHWAFQTDSLVGIVPPQGFIHNPSQGSLQNQAAHINNIISNKPGGWASMNTQNYSGGHTQNSSGGHTQNSSGGHGSSGHLHKSSSTTYSGKSGLVTTINHDFCLAPGGTASGQVNLSQYSNSTGAGLSGMQTMSGFGTISNMGISQTGISHGNSTGMNTTLNLTAQGIGGSSIGGGSSVRKNMSQTHTGGETHKGKSPGGFSDRSHSPSPERSMVDRIAAGHVGQQPSSGQPGAQGLLGGLSPARDGPQQGRGKSPQTHIHMVGMQYGYGFKDGEKPVLSRGNVMPHKARPHSSRSPKGAMGKTHHGGVSPAGAVSPKNKFGSPIIAMPQMMMSQLSASTTGSLLNNTTTTYVTHNSGEVSGHQSGHLSVGGGPSMSSSYQNIHSLQGAAGKHQQMNQIQMPPKGLGSQLATSHQSVSLPQLHFDTNPHLNMGLNLPNAGVNHGHQHPKRQASPKQGKKVMKTQMPTKQTSFPKRLKFLVSMNNPSGNVP